MYCSKKTEDEAKYNVTLEFKRSEILYDIENYAYVEADIMKTEDEHDKHQLFDVGQDGNVDLVTRVLSLAHRECVEMLYPYTKSEPVDGTVLDDTLESPEVYIVEMSLPGQFSHTTVKLLKQLIHKYIVCRVMSEWVGITKPTSAEYWFGLLEQTKERIKTALMSRRTRLRRRQSIF